MVLLSVWCWINISSSLKRTSVRLLMNYITYKDKKIGPICNKEMIPDSNLSRLDLC